MRDRPPAHDPARRRVLLIGAPVIIALSSVLGVVVVDRFGGVGEPVPVAGVVGSEKVALFDDERVRERFAELGYDVRVRTRCPAELPDSGAAHRQGPLISGRAGRAARWQRCR
ncbi:hypothetical protein ACWFMI_04040 [Nocardiopsis terrae]